MQRFVSLRLLGGGLLALSTLWLWGATSPEPVPTDRESLFEFITTDIDGEPLYRTWPLFPSHADANAGPEGYDKDYFLKRLGLPVHGRWVTTYVNPIAYDYLFGAISAPPDSVLSLPIGAIIVKENYRTDVNFKPANNADTLVLKPKGLPPRPAVLTVMSKVGPEECGTGYRYNGTDCFGGEWLFAYYGVNPVSVLFDDFIESQTFCVNCHAPALDSDYLRSLQAQRMDVRPAHPSTTPEPPPPAGVADFCENLTGVSFDLPHDVGVNPTTVGNPQKLFDCLSWKTFVALNWPANALDRGQPDTTITSVADPAFMDGPRVWETYKETYAVFQPDSLSWVPNPDWNAPQPPPDGAGCDASGMAILSMDTKSQSRSTIDVADETGQAFAGQFGALVDQNGHLTRYEVRFNRDEFNYIINTQSAVTQNLTPVGPVGGRLPDNRQGDFGGSIEVKAAWRQMCTPEWELETGRSCFPAVDDTTQYFTQDVLVYHPKSNTEDAFCEEVQMGLVALHIAHKTFWAPQWVWSTFSFKGNAPLAQNRNPQATPYFDPARAKNAPATECWQAPFLISPKDCPNVELNRFLPAPDTLPPGFTWPGTNAPNQVTRLVPPQGSGLNATFSRLLQGTPFANYELLDTQWPLNGRDPQGRVNQNNCPNNGSGPECYTKIPTYLRNPVVETYMTTYNYQRQQYSNRSCMGCHSSGRDFSYIWLDGVEQVVPIDND